MNEHRELVITLPTAFAGGIVAEFGEAGRAWLDRLPDVVDSLCQDWDLTLDGAPSHGHLGLVVPVRQRGAPRVLKVAWIEETMTFEGPALAAWRGNGAVRLHDSSPERGALLLERLDADRSLFDLDLTSAITVSAGLLRRLAIPAPEGFLHQSEIARRLRENVPARWETYGRPFPRPVLDRTLHLVAMLAAPVSERLVNFDLHYGNVLAGRREPWLAIDPKVIAGDPEYGVAQMLWRRLDEMAGPTELRRHLRTIIDVAGLDPQRTHAWAIVRVVDYWLWALSIGLTEDPRRCATLIEWLSDGISR